MLALARPETSSLLRCLVVAVILVAGVFVLAPCAEDSSSTCAHEYLSSTDRSKHPVMSLARRLQAAFVVVVSSASGESLTATTSGLSSARSADVLGAPQLRLAALRI